MDISLAQRVPVARSTVVNRRSRSTELVSVKEIYTQREGPVGPGGHPAIVTPLCGDLGEETPSHVEGVNYTAGAPQHRHGSKHCHTYAGDTHET